MAGERHANAHSLDYYVEEAEGLARAINLTVVETQIINVSRPTPSMLFGKGQVENIAGWLQGNEDVRLVIVSGALSPIQQRTLEKAWQAKVIDRTGLILEIFGARAQTREGRLQVEMAALGYQKSRLVRSWTHLERQRGGAGFMGGPGETQLEIDRRIITDKMAKLKKELDQVKRTRRLARKSRERVPFPIIALVGYTNAGKSTLFNALTGENVYAEDLPFATLDPTMRLIEVGESKRRAIMSDTVGFITDLPTHLVNAFRATLEEVEHADLILHVRDIASPVTENQKQDVNRILEELGIDPEQGNSMPIIEVWNKMDLIEESDRGFLMARARNAENVQAVSALNGMGLDELLTTIESRLVSEFNDVDVYIKSSEGAILSWLHREGAVLAQDQDNDMMKVTVSLSSANLGRLKAAYAERVRIEEN